LLRALNEQDQAIADELFSDVYPLLKQDAEAGVGLFNKTGRRRGSLADCLIAALCLRLDAVLATANTQDFSFFQSVGLRLA
jgi:predicted nucleic acid-binding protein